MINNDDISIKNKIPKSDTSIMGASYFHKIKVEEKFSIISSLLKELNRKMNFYINNELKDNQHIRYLNRPNKTRKTIDQLRIITVKELKEFVDLIYGREENFYDE